MSTAAPVHTPPTSEGDKTLRFDDDKAVSTTSSAALQARLHEPPDSYESKHRWDPTATWTAEEEKKVLRRVDRRVMIVACISFAALQLDRLNISNAISDSFLADTKLSILDYNAGMTIFLCCFMAAELPSQLISKKIGSDVWIPIQMMGWSVIAIAQCGIKNKKGFLVTRALLGLLEGGFIPDTILYLSYYYTSSELTVRLAWFWVSFTFTNILGAFLATGILELRHHSGWAGWRWLFALEGALTFLIGLFVFFYLPPSPSQTHLSLWGRITGRSWFSEREQVIIVNKVLRDDPTKSSMHNRQGLSFSGFWKSLCDYDMWPLYFIGIMSFIGPATIAAYFSIQMRFLGFTVMQTNLLSIPASVLTMIGGLALAYTANKRNDRLVTASVGSLWMLAAFIALVAMPVTVNKWTKWAIYTLIIGFPYSHPLMVSLSSGNAGSVRTRTVATTLYNMFVQAGLVIAANIYQLKDLPRFKKGNRVLLGTVAASIPLFYLAKAWYIWRNRQRAKVWDNMTADERDEYLRTTTDQGNKRLDFRFMH